MIQGAESGLFLSRIQSLLDGEDQFYDSIYTALGISLPAIRWELEPPSASVVNADPSKQVAVASLIRAWRERGHLAADIDPPCCSAAGASGSRPLAHGLTIWDLDRIFDAGGLRSRHASRSARPPAPDLRREVGRRVHALRTIPKSAAGSNSSWSIPGHLMRKPSAGH